MEEWINDAAEGKAFLFLPVYFGVVWASLALIVFVAVMLVAAASTPFVVANLLLMRMFGVRLNYHAALFLALAVEAAPPGLSGDVRQLPWPDSRAGWFHSLSWQDERAAKQITEWLRADRVRAHPVDVTGRPM